MSRLAAAKTDCAASPDGDLAKAIAAGDQDGFPTLMRRFNRLLYRTAHSIVQDDFDADDVMQSAYLLAYRDMGKFRGEAKLSTWLVRIVINEALLCRRKRARFAHNVDLDDVQSEDILESATEPTGNRPELLEEALIRGELRRLMAARIDKLPQPYRMVFVLRAIDELSVAETAASLRIPEATVRTRFFRARTRLREMLSLTPPSGFEMAFPPNRPKRQGPHLRPRRAVACSESSPENPRKHARGFIRDSGHRERAGSALHPMPAHATVSLS